jgi:hypothetical protein
VTQAADHARVLLSLAFATPRDGLASLSEADWVRIDELAAQHRLQPWLAERWEGAPGPIPEPILQGWRESRRHAAITALGQRADLLACVRRLDEAGIPSVALKGAWFAWHAYPAPALRPMHDIDLLAAPERAVSAYESLQDSGWRRTRPFEQGLAHTLAHDKHLPQLTSAAGSVIELHIRCWKGDVPRPRDAAILSRARRMTPDDPVRYPAASDLFAHLAIHAAVEGRFDCGALALLDLEMLLRRERLDWPAIFAEAEAEGWLRHAALLLTLADRWLHPGLLAETGCPLQVPASVADTAERLMVQDLSTCREAQFLADLSAAAAGGRLLRTGARRLLGRPAHIGGAESAERDFSRDGGYVPWLADRVRRTVAAMFGTRVRQQAAGYRRVSAWCGGTDKGG